MPSTSSHRLSARCFGPAPRRSGGSDAGYLTNQCFSDPAWTVERKLDGEVVAFDGRQTSFARLRPRLGLIDPAGPGSPVSRYGYLFDLMTLDGFELTALPLRARKRVLRAAVLPRSAGDKPPHDVVRERP